MIIGIILSHGPLAEAMVEACKCIIGEIDHLYALRCDDCSRDSLYEQLTHLVTSSEARDGVFIFVGLKGGSCWNVAARVVHEHDRVELISGVNISLILSFLMKRDRFRFENLGEILINDAFRGITRYTK
ncbi:MAG: hypothetical protein D6813_12695 [Calditrichaeota bacterium]|nr:MAG: hypothetical protein D6813_12695 [Calditrichota bacterium]